MRKAVRVWSQDRLHRHGIVASSLQEVKKKGAAKLNYAEDLNLFVVLEEDGTNVDDAYWESLQPDTRLILLRPDEVWQPAPLPIPNKKVFVFGDETDSSVSSQQRATNLLTALQQNPASVALLSLSDLEVIKDANINTPEIMRQCSQSVQLQELCIEFYVKKKKEAEALELVDLLRENTDILHENLMKGTKS
ncbi:hypothetical protein SK128_019013 [Halocaridina rubra]|uniref:CIDE-N domain-containing protein n=1 Tax=Halocaridina rubra TaxID=373956 RepID=A0AAN8X461_HALRR